MNKRRSFLFLVKVDCGIVAMLQTMLYIESYKGVVVKAFFCLNGCEYVTADVFVLVSLICFLVFIGAAVIVPLLRILFPSR